MFAHEWMPRGIGVARQCPESHAAAVFLDFRERQAVDIDESIRLLDAFLHQVD